MKTITIGRTPDNHIVIPNHSVSRKHASITLDETGRYTLQDLGSSNGTFVNGKRIERVQLQYNDIVKLGETIIPWQSYFQNESHTAQSVRGKVIRVVRIGRDSSNDVVLTEDFVSSMHAMLALTDQKEYEIRDMGSSNGTFVNDRRVQQALLHPGDVVKIGRKVIDWMAHLTDGKTTSAPAKKTPAAGSPKMSDLKTIVIALLVAVALVALIVWAVQKSYSDENLIDPGPEETLLPEPPEIPGQVVVLKEEILNELFKKCQLSGEHRQLVQACDFTNLKVRNLAVELAGKSPGKFNIGQVCEIFDYCFKNWKYVNDPQSGDFISSASNTVETHLNGDCDDFAILMNSLILAIGGNSCINYAYNDTEGHAYTEVCLGKGELKDLVAYLSKRYSRNISGQGGKVNYRTDQQGQIWLNLDWSAEFPGGAYFNATQGRRFYILNNYCEDF